jgi:sulfate adenylyltransferase
MTQENDSVSPPPHGGIAEPVNRIISREEAEELKQGIGEMPRYSIAEADLATLHRIADGALPPLTGPMNRNDYQTVLEGECIVRDGHRFAWGIPVILAITEEERESLREGERCAITSDGNAVGVLRVEDVYPWKKGAYLKAVYGTSRTDHPGARIALEDPRDWLMGGTVEVFPWDENPAFSRYILSPRESRDLFARKGWKRIIAFQTRNPLHRAHEYVMVAALERLLREGYLAGVVLNPLVGQLKTDDVPAEVRMLTYRRLIEDGLFGLGDVDESLWGDKNISDHVALLGIDIKMYYAGPREAIMHAIYRQNYGFTDLIIGRRHADAPYDDGKSIWGDFDAQEKFENLSGELRIHPLKIGFAAYYEGLGRVGLVAEHKDKGWKPVTIAGRVLRQMFTEGKTPDPRVIRPETSKILIEYYAARQD